MALNACVLICITACLVQSVSALCSSVEYVNSMRAVLSKQSDYAVYEGKLTFRLNGSVKYGFNPSGIYGAPHFEHPADVSNPRAPTAHVSYYLRSSSALIFPGCTPPKSRYFSFTSYLMTRFNDVSPDNIVIDEQKMLYASLGASLNNLVWNTTNTSSNFDSLTTVIQTGDNSTFEYLYTLLTESGGLHAAEINLQSLPNQYINWLPYKYNTSNVHHFNLTYDTGSFLLRVSLPDNHQEYEEYIHTNQTVFLLHPLDVDPDAHLPKQPFDAVRRDTYSPFNLNESAVYHDALNEYKQDLIAYIEATYNVTQRATEPFYDLAPNDYGFGCIESNKNCGGDCRDGLYWEANFVSIGKQQLYLMLGVMHSNDAIRQAVYSNIVLEREHNLAITMAEYNGSALILPVKTSVDRSYLQNMFVVQLTNPSLCIAALPGFCFNETTHLSQFSVMVRTYLNPMTKTRPDLKEIVKTLIIKFEA